MNAGELATRMGLSGIPREAEIIMLERDIRLAAMTGGRYHAAHISTSDSVAIIKRAKDAGLKVTCDTAPFYFALNELSVGDYRTFAKLSPPLRSEEDRQAIVEGLKTGVIDAIASDHSPQDQDSKRLPYPQAAFGGSGLETLLAVSLDLFHNGELSLIEVVRRLTLAPASLLGLRAGRLAKGAKADLVLFDPSAGWKVIADNFRSKSKNSPFDGRPVQGRVLRTVVDGRVVFDAMDAPAARPSLKRAANR
jgi:dihydroorotase